MKRLFCVVNSNGKLVKDGDKSYFRLKVVAKGFRTECNNSTPGHTIARGPDHIGPHGNGKKPHKK